MIKLQNTSELPDSIYQELGWDWFLGDGEWKYLTSDMLVVSEEEGDALYDAANELYQMYIEAVDYVIKKELWNEMGIPFNMIKLIKETWNDERQLHLYGRFDLAGGVNGLPIKLMEFNADTPTTLPETAIIQWAQLKANNIDTENQFNEIYENLVAQFEQLKEVNKDLTPTLLISAMREAPEDDANVEVIGEAAQEAGFKVEYRYIEEVVFSPEEGIFVDYGDDHYEKFDFWFKLVPWEYIAYDEPKLMQILSKIILDRKALVLNPPYTLLMQSKALMKIIWDLHGHHPLLLNTSLKEPVRYEAYVKKVIFGREGANITIYDKTGIPVKELGGDYSAYSSIYQEFTELIRDEKGQYYQAGLFYIREAAGLGFRRGGLIIDEDAEFVGHYHE